MGHIDPEQWAGSLLHLRALRKDGLLTTAHVETVATSYGVTARTIWRRLSTAPPPGGDPLPTRRGPAPYELTQTDLIAYILYNGNIAYLHRARTGVLDNSLTVAGGPIPQTLIDGWREAQPVSLRTLHRAFTNQLSSGMLAGMTEGEAGWRRHQVYLDRDSVPRNQIWEMDHKQLSVMVLPSRGAATNPWLTSVVDCGSRALLGWCLSTQPTQSTVLTSLRMALTHAPARGPFGGVPRLVRVDQGLEFAAESVQAALGSLSVARNRLPGYAPHLKGKIERLHRTVEQTLIQGLPGHTRGARDKAGRLLGPLGDDPKSRANAPQAQVKPWTLEHFAQRFARWAQWYNATKPHSMLNGATPLQAWEADPFEVYRIPAETLRHLLMATKEHVIQKNGINYKSRTYYDPKLNGRGGERVVLRYMPHEHDYVEVYQNGEHLCTARTKDNLTEEEKDEIFTERRESAAELKRLHAHARKAARDDLMLAGDAPETQQATSTSLHLTRTTPPRPAAPPPAPPAAKKTKPAARHDLLGIAEPFAESDAEPFTQPPVDLSSFEQPDHNPIERPQ
ncbi:Mu transposase C-terminal domain-containing protein [Actinomadura sp. 21ATH]|uniref:Mu transposase C-terminal domain-containing protein n=1 Tax=Actinomadura sp. 21ATH TaxID=1735444 RepID=UPI0035C126B6